MFASLSLNVASFVLFVLHRCQIKWSFLQCAALHTHATHGQYSLSYHILFDFIMNNMLLGAVMQESMHIGSHFQDKNIASSATGKITLWNILFKDAQYELCCRTVLKMCMHFLPT